MHKMKTVVYTGSFDIVTNGHLWIIEQIAQMFDKCVIAIGTNADKKYLLPFDVRFQLLQDLTKNFVNIEVVKFEHQYLINFAQQINAQYMIRGIRNIQDYEYERTMRHINYDINKNINTVFLMPPRELAEVSSSLVKGLIGIDGWEEIILKYVPLSVANFIISWYHKNIK